MAKMSGWMKAGLFAGAGCLSIVGVIVIGLVVAATVARSRLNQMGDTNPVRSERTIALPAVSPAATPRQGAPPVETAPLRLTIDLQEGVFTIRPGAPGSDVQVEGMWAPALYELTQDDQETAGGRELTIRFASKGPTWVRMLGGMFDGQEDRQPRVTVVIPRGTPMDLDLSVGLGASRIDLGGLTLGELDLNLAMGEHRVDFTEPLPPGMRRLDLSASMGDVDIEHIGNTRAPIVEASGSMGNLRADLGGAWTPAAAAQVSFAQSMGELTVRVPTSVRLETAFETSMGEAQNRGAGAPETDDPQAALLRMKVATSMGETRIVRY
jgi:hypothetical protein